MSAVELRLGLQRLAKEQSTAGHIAAAVLAQVGYMQ